MHSHLEKTKTQIREHCSLIRDTISQDQIGSTNWHGLEERLDRYLGRQGLLYHIDKALTSVHKSESRNRALKDLIEEVRKCRAWVLDAAEQAIAPSPRWIPIRARLLKYFGHRGIEGLLTQLIHESQERGGSDES